MSTASQLLASRQLTPGLRQVQRLVLAAMAGVLVTAGLYWLMAELVAAGRGALSEAPEGRIVDFVRVKKDQNLETDPDKPKKPPAPEAPPPETPQEQQRIDAPGADVVDIGRLNVGDDLSLGGAGLSASDGEYLPIVKVAPIYPRRAQERGLEGWVLLSFTVTKTGAVRDPIVIESEPRGVFDRAAERAVLKFKYKPRVINGEAQEVPGVEHLITFELED